MIRQPPRFTVVFGELWYTTDPGRERADVVRYNHLKHPLPGSRAEEFTTVWIDLANSEQALLAGMNKNTRYEVRRGEADNLVYEAWYKDSTTRLSEFQSFFDEFAGSKGLDRADPEWLRRYAGAGALDLSCARGADGRALVWHAHYRDAVHARLRYSASVYLGSPDPKFRGFVGRANRWQHWRDMLRFRREGVTLLDLGGIYTGIENKELLGINEFKQGFGGELVKTYNCLRGETLKGRLYLRASGLRHRILR